MPPAALYYILHTLYFILEEGFLACRRRLGRDGGTPRISIRYEYTLIPAAWKRALRCEARGRRAVWRLDLFERHETLAERSLSDTATEKGSWPSVE